MNVRVPAGWRMLDPSYGLRFQVRMIRFLLPAPREQADAAVLEIRYVPIGLPPPRIRGWRGAASEKMVEARLQAWEEEFPGESRTRPLRRTGAFDVEAGTAVSLAAEGSWRAGPEAGAPRAHESRPGYALLGAVVPSRPAGEGERQYAFLLRAVGPLETLSAAAEPFASFVRSARTDDTFAF